MGPRLRGDDAESVVTAFVPSSIKHAASRLCHEPHPRVAGAFSNVETPVTGLVTTVAICALS